MPAYPTKEYKDYRELLDDMDVAIIAVKSFGTMVEHSIRTGDDLSEDGYGMERLLNLQCRQLENIAIALRTEFAEFKVAKLKVRDVNEIAEWAGVSKDTAKRVVECAVGIELDVRPTKRASKPQEADHASA